VDPPASPDHSVELSHVGGPPVPAALCNEPGAGFGEARPQSTERPEEKIDRAAARRLTFFD